MGSQFYNKQQIERFNYYRQAAPLIELLKKDKGNHVIQTLSRADELTLLASYHLAEGNELQPLIEVFLTQRDDELEQVDRKVLIQLLRRQDLAQSILEFIHVLEKEFIQSGPQNEEVALPNIPEAFAQWVDACCSDSLSAHQRIELERKISKMLQECDLELGQPCFFQLASFYKNNTIFALVGTIKNRANLKHFFASILHTDALRDVLFKGIYEVDFNQFLLKNNAVSCFAQFLRCSYDKPWFAEGFASFASFAKSTKKVNFLSDVLTTIKIDSVGVILSAILHMESTAITLLKDFFNDHALVAVQENKNSELSKIAAHFDKQHIMQLFNQLDQTEHWHDKPHHKILFYLLHHQFASYFDPKEFTKASTSEWQTAELDVLCRVLHRQLSNNRPFDHQGAIGQKLLGELLCRCAHAGSTALFYNKDGLHKTLLKLSITKTFFKKLVDYYWVPDGVKEQFPETGVRIHAVFDGAQLRPKELNNELLLADWHRLMLHTWQYQENAKLPIICVYLMYYEGTRDEVARLLRDYFNTFQHKIELIHQLTQLMRCAPQREISAIIFEVTLEILLKNPQLLNVTLLHDMACFYDKTVSKAQADFPQKELNLLQYFGHHQYYVLVQNGCQAYLAQTHDKSLKKLMSKGIIEAEVEGRLNTLKGHMYFGFIKSALRFWYYGLGGKKRGSSIIAWCDETASSLELVAPQYISKPTHSGEWMKTAPDFNGKKNQFIKLLAAVSNSSKRMDPEISSPAYEELFKKSVRVDSAKDVVNGSVMVH